MANSLSGVVWKVDTFPTTVTTDAFLVASIRWVGATTAGHTASITNTAGKVLWASIASGANYVEESVPYESCIPWNGAVVTAQSGIVYVHLA